MVLPYPQSRSFFESSNKNMVSTADQKVLLLREDRNAKI